MTDGSKQVMDYHRPDSKSVRRQILPALLIVLLLFLLLGIVVCGLVPVYPSGRVAAARQKATAAEIANLSIVLDAFKNDTGRYPSTAEGLKALVKCPAGLAGWRGPYLDEVPQDKWGNGYRYEFPGKVDPKEFDITAAGGDGAFGTADDIDRSTKP